MGEAFDPDVDHQRKTRRFLFGMAVVTLGSRRFREIQVRNSLILRSFLRFDNPQTDAYRPRTTLNPGADMGTLTINASYGNSLTSLNNDGNSADQAVYNGYTSAITTTINYFDTNFQTLGTTNVAFSLSFGYGSIPNATCPTARRSPARGDFVQPANTELQFGERNQPSFYSVISSAYNSTNNANATALQTGAISNGIIPATSPFGVNGGVVVMTPAQEALLSPAITPRISAPMDLCGASIGIQANTVANAGTPASTWVWSESSSFPASTDTVSYQTPSVLGTRGIGGHGRGTNGGAITTAYSPLPEYGLEDFFAYTAAYLRRDQSRVGRAFGSAAAFRTSRAGHSNALAAACRHTSRRMAAPSRCRSDHRPIRPATTSATGHQRPTATQWSMGRP